MVTVSAQQGVRTTPVMGWEIEQLEYDERVARVRQELERRRLDALVLFHPIRMAYTSGFYHVSTERPMAIVIPLDPMHGLGRADSATRAGPHCQVTERRSAVKVYPEYPSGGRSTRCCYLADLLREMDLAGTGHADRVRLERLPRYQRL